MIFHVLPELGPEVLQKGGVHHLLEPGHFVSRVGERDENRVLQIPRPPRKLSLGDGVYRRLVLLHIMHNFVDRELSIRSRPNQSARDTFCCDESKVLIFFLT